MGVSYSTTTTPPRRNLNMCWCVDAVRQGEGEEPFLVAVFASEDFKPSSAGGNTGVAPESAEFVVWVCDKLAHSRDETLNWTACGSFVGTKVQNCPVSTRAENVTHVHVPSAVVLVFVVDGRYSCRLWILLISVLIVGVVERNTSRPRSVRHVTPCAEKAATSSACLHALFFNVC